MASFQHSKRSDNKQCKIKDTISVETKQLLCIEEISDIVIKWWLSNEDAGTYQWY